METKRYECTENAELVEKLEDLLELAKKGQITECKIEAKCIREPIDECKCGDVEEKRKNLKKKSAVLKSRLKTMERGVRIMELLGDFNPIPLDLVKEYNDLVSED